MEGLRQFENGTPVSATNVTSEPRVGWLFLDLNSYFASVEQQLNPAFRSRPIAVVPVKTDTTCCIAVSYEAKAFGVKTGTQVGDAKRLCPAITLIEARHEVYVDYHNRIVQAVESCVPVACVLSIDEMACRLLGREQPLLTAMQLARRVKATIREQVGDTLRCSVGLAPNRYLAKVASDMEKPDGLTALTRDLLPQALLRLKLRDLVGIGGRMERRLHTHGIRNMASLLACTPEQLRQAWGGIQGERLWHWLRGTDFYDAETEHPKSIGHQHVLPPDLRTIDGSYAVAQKLLHKAAMRLRIARMWAASMTLTLHFVVPKNNARGKHSSGIPRQSWSEVLRLVECQDTQTLIEGLQKLWAMRPKGKLYQKPFMVGVTLIELVPNNLHTLGLFEQEESEQHRAQLTMTMDEINAKYGTHTLYFGGMHLARAAAPTRIAFSSIPDLF
ncbi:MAG TPA: DNA polymerase [Acidobacteriaceae bacterium]|jgi:DNA polymerase-4|nr:DNA polymerase [Acidobacteriaceae bacterium]